MTDEELDQQDKQEQKEERQEENKKTLKTVITSVICTLLFVVILLLLVILCLKNCSNRNNNNTSSSNSISEPTYNYDNELLNNQFIKIVNFERQAIGYEEVPSKVIAVSYTDNYPDHFSISITATAGNTLYYYNISNYSYSGDTSSHDNCIGYISTLDITTRLDSVGAVQTIQSSTVTNETIETNKGNHYVISSASPLKYFSGFYLDNNQYKVYNYTEFTSGDNPFNSEPSFKVNSNDPLYGYYQELAF